MATSYSLELRYVIDEALDSADQLNEEFNSLHLLFAMFMLDNSGGMLLTEEGFSEETLLPFVDRSESESKEAVEELMQFTEDTAEKYRDPEVNCLHLILALCRHRSTIAHRLLERADVPIPGLRNRAVSLLVNKMPKRYTEIFEEHDRRKKAQAAQRPLGADRLQPAPAASVPRPAVTTETRTLTQEKAPGQASCLPLRLPVLSEVAVDMVLEAARGGIGPVEGRREEMEELADILNKRKANNPLIVGPPGVGKTALVEGLAWLLAHRPSALPGLEGRRIFRLEPAKLLKGTHLRGSFSERMDALRREVRAAAGRVVIFLDETHQIAQGSVDGSQEIAQELKTVLADGEFPCIGATTGEEYRKSIARDPVLSRRFHVLELEEPSETETLAILASLAESLKRHHGVSFEPEALKLALRLSGRYMRDRHQPDKSLTILDLAGSRARRLQGKRVDERIVSEVVAQLANLPVDQLVVDEAERYLELETRLGGRIVGHRAVLRKIAEALRRNAAGFGGDRPMGSFLFVGPTGVGKTEIARALAAELFGDRDALLRFDMSEFSEPHSVAKLIGSPPGYVGFQDGAALTDTIRLKPFRIVLLDEVEKAHQNVHQLLLSLLDDGRLTDSLGQTADFTNCVVIMTSNIGGDTFQKKSHGIGFGGAQDADRPQREVLEAVKRVFSPELYNRIDEKIVFSPLSEAEFCEVARLLLDASAKKLAAEKRITLEFTPEVSQALVSRGGYDARYGARPMRRTIQNLIEGPLASMILKGEIRRADTVLIRPDEGRDFIFELGERR